MKVPKRFTFRAERRQRPQKHCSIICAFDAGIYIRVIIHTAGESTIIGREYSFSLSEEVCILNQLSISRVCCWTSAQFILLVVDGSSSSVSGLATVGSDVFFVQMTDVFLHQTPTSKKIHTLLYKACIKRKTHSYTVNVCVGVDTLLSKKPIIFIGSTYVQISTGWFAINILVLPFIC